MRMTVFVAAFVLLLAACVTTAPESLPLHPSAIAIPPGCSATYVFGYRTGWVAEITMFAHDIDHKRTFVEDVGTGDGMYLEGYFQGATDAEAFVRQLILASGKTTARNKLVEALKGYRVPNQLPAPTSPSVTPPAGAGGAPFVAADH